MGKVNVIFIVFLIKLTVDCVKIDSEKILSDEFIEEINDIQLMWTADRNFHKESQVRNLLSVSFKRQYKFDYKVTTTNTTIPVSFDSRKNWPKCITIGQVKTQGNCASSHAIVASSVFSDRLCVQNNVVRYSSADQVLTCCKKCGAGCFGGHIERSFEYMKNVGSVTGGEYQSKIGCRPYKIAPCPTQNKLTLCTKIRERTPSCYFWKCSNSNYKNNTYDSDKQKLKSIYAVPSKVEDIQAEIMVNGPISSTITIHEDFFNYKSGIYYHAYGAKVGELDVKIIGWDEEPTPYWIVVNSWGKNWGEKGMFKIKLGVNECNIEQHILAGSF